MVVVEGMKSFLFSEIIATEFAKQLGSMLNNHPNDPERDKINIEIVFKTSQNNEGITKRNIIGYLKPENPCEKIQSKIIKLKKTDMFSSVAAKIEQLDKSNCIIRLNF